jgi:ankyrin repeat protein
MSLTSEFLCHPPGFFSTNRYPLHFAALKGDLNIVRALLDAHAEVNKQDWDNYAPLHFCARVGFVAGAAAMLEKGAAINIQSRKRETPLVVAVENNQTEMVRFLIDSHADVQRTALLHRNPLFFATEGAICQMLIEAGTTVNRADDEGTTSLQVAAEKGLHDVVKLLLENHAQVDAQDAQKQTALHKAADNGHDKVVELLLQHRASLKQMDVQKMTPELLARKKKHFNVLSAISEYYQSHEDAVDYRRYS